MKDKKWMDNFITQEKDTGIYICWDETQTDEIGRVTSLEDAYQLLQDYANSILSYDPR